MKDNPIHVLGFLLIVALAVYFAMTRIPVVPTEDFKKLGSYFRWNSPITTGGSPQSGGSGGGYGGGNPPNVNPSDIPAGFTPNQLSPNFRKVRFTSVSPGYFGTYGQVGLYSYVPAGVRVNVTGWQIRGNRGSIFIPQAVGVYDPTGLSEESDIQLGSGETVYLYSSMSAIGRNLRLNKCLGYLENQSHFTPPLPRNCPTVSRSEVSGLRGACQDYILSLGSCQLPAPNVPVAATDDACRSFLDTINYRGCFDRRRADADFMGREWWAWTGSKFLDERHDRVLLFDREGLLVDEYSY